MNITAIQPEDFKSVLALNTDSVPHVNRISLGELQWFADNATFATTCKIDGRLAGFMIGLRPGTSYKSTNYRWFCEHYDDFAYVDRVAVCSWARRRGIAGSLYRAFAASQSDAPRMTCEVNTHPANEVSMHFHENLGFRQVGSLASADGDKEVALLEKRL